MSFPLEYHHVVKPAVIEASLALFGMLLLISSSPAQNNSTAYSGHSVTATPGATSPRVTTNSGTTSSARKPPSTTSQSNNSRPQPAAIPLPYYYYPYVYAVPVPYTADVLDNGASDDNDPDYQGGPTVFDRRGDGPSSYIPPGYESPAESNAGEAQTQDSFAPEYNSDSEPSPDPTVLIFKDGHQLEIGNYAIVNQTIYDLTPGHPRKIALADLDLPATQKLNDDRGITFDLPPSAQAN
ncbi:MAG: hypothetical protein WAK89_07670 [Candidatus Sulfotelmatobacter sp.]